MFLLLERLCYDTLALLLIADIHLEYLQQVLDMYMLAATELLFDTRYPLELKDLLRLL